MKSVLAIFYLALLFVQAIPVGQFFSDSDQVFYTYVDEDKPDTGKLKEKKELKEYLGGIETPAPTPETARRYRRPVIPSPADPVLAFFTPPPDVACS